MWVKSRVLKALHWWLQMHYARRCRPLRVNAFRFSVVKIVSSRIEIRKLRKLIYLCAHHLRSCLGVDEEGLKSGF